MAAWANVAALAVGGAVGANLRYWLGRWISGWAGTHFPWATFTINVTGSFALGFLATAAALRLAGEPQRLAVLSGFLGAYTTFSTFELEALALWHDDARPRALLYLLASVAAGFAAAALGVAAGRRLGD